MHRPICIFRPGTNTEDELADLESLLSDEILDRKVVVISIAGRFRQGKSFLMNFLIKYLRARGAPGWLEKESANALEGFDWRHTRKRVTIGVLIWPEVFKIKNTSGEEMVVILVDTQGVFDTDTTIKDCTSIFSLSVLLSSIQIFNIKQNIQGDDLGHLELFTEFGRLVSSENAKSDSQHSQKPFQDLIFLVRDWAYPDEKSYGWDGGQKVLDEELQKVNLEGELAAMRTSIKKCFESLQCFLMPHPGEKVDASSKFKGNVADIKPGFVKYMKTFVEDIFRTSDLKPKRVHGKDLTVRDFLVFVELYAREMHSDRLPTPQTLYDATVNATNSAVVNSCFEMYEARASALVSGDPHEPAHFEALHDSILTDIVAHFNQSTKMGTECVMAASLGDLKARIAAGKEHFKRVNSTAFEKAQLDAQTQRLQEEQHELQRQITAMGDANGDLNRRILAAEAEKVRIAEEARKKQEEIQRQIMQLTTRRRRRRRRGGCTIS